MERFIEGEDARSSLGRLIAEGLASAPLKARRSLPTRGISVTEPVSPLVSELRGPTQGVPR